MTWKFITGSLAAMALMGGCAGTAPNATRATDMGNNDSSAISADSSSSQQMCNADMAENAVGQKLSAQLIEASRVKAGAKLARGLRPRDVITMEYNPQRLNLRADEQDVVISVNCS